METKKSTYSFLACWVYAVLAWLFVASIMIQFILAGLPIFGDTANWDQHATFVHMFQYIPVVMLLIGLIGKLKNGLRWWPLGLLAFIALQYWTAHMIFGQAAAALHPLIAALLFFFSIKVAKKASRIVLPDRRRV
ncbi:DUF6220 domain-containing protein [Paenibacillus sedimenti]|uniref:Uncharacterized protein n=1 Tax=Paenibacillus sedimenti TaxID=2770274 RepID=A0A926KRY5_9BACL|nr:DUF6220 domain-containing protein [Paenibacillus sedimenti]MBD0382860.1 hypothetical protein [Paenibacillus sedimenti]